MTHITEHKRIHLIGIGGCSMSGLASILKNRGYYVQGSDRAESPFTERLKELGVPVFIGHDAKNIGHCDLIIFSAAIKPDNIERAEAKRRGIPELDEKGSFRVEMNESLATVLITNLLKNAYVHNIENGHIHILLTTNRIIFRNSSEQTALDENRIFERFYQGCKKEGSTGLGLAIAHSICKQYGLLLSYTYQNKEHCFCIEKSK